MDVNKKRGTKHIPPKKVFAEITLGTNEQLKDLCDQKRRVDIFERFFVLTVVKTMICLPGQQHFSRAPESARSTFFKRNMFFW